MTDSARAAGPGARDARPLFVMAFGPSFAALAAVFAVAALIILTSSPGWSALAPTVAGLWLGIHQVPVTISNITIGVLPLLPTVVLVAAVARAARRAAGYHRTLTELRSVLLCAVAGPALFTAIALAVINDSGGEFTLATPPPLTAFLCTIAVHLGGALLGLLPAYWRDIAQLLRVPTWVDDCVRLAGRALLAFGAVGLAIVVVRLAFRWETTYELIRSGNDAMGMISLVVLSVLYLPNAVIGAAALPVGAHAQLGPITMSVFSSTPGQAPAVPLLAVLPQGDSPWYLLLLLIVPAVIALWMGKRCAVRSLALGPTVAAVATTAALTAAGFTVAAYLAGGELGGFGYAGAGLLPLFGFVLGWMGLLGVLAALVLQQAGETREVRAARRAAQEEPSGYTTYADDPDLLDESVASAQTQEIEPVDREAVTAGDSKRDEATGREDADPAHTAPVNTHAEDEPEPADTGDFDALANEPTHEVHPAARKPRSSRDRSIADIEELDSYTFGQ